MAAGRNRNRSSASGIVASGIVASGIVASGLFGGLLILASFFPVSQARAEEPQSETERLMGEGLSKILQALDLLLMTVPQYAAPEVQPNGDIIIRRLNPEDDTAPAEPADPEKPADAPPEGDSTET